MNSEDTKWLINFFKKSPLFSSMPENEINTLIDHMDRANYTVGDVICNEGETGEWFYVASKGRIKIIKKKREFLKTVDAEIGFIGPDDIFGEISLLENKPRTATLIAEEDVVCFKLFKSKFNELLEKLPALKKEIEILISKRNPKSN